MCVCLCMCFDCLGCDYVLTNSVRPIISEPKSPSHTQDIMKLVGPLLSIIDGRIDQPSKEQVSSEDLEEWRARKRFQRSKNNKWVAEAKVI